MKFILTLPLIICLTLPATLALAKKPTYPPEMPGARTEFYRSIDTTELKAWIFEPVGHSADDARLDIDPNHIAAGGGSAGGHLAAATATLPGHNDNKSTKAVSSIPNALVLFNPVLMSPYHNVRPGPPPTTIVSSSSNPSRYSRIAGPPPQSSSSS